MKSYNEGNLYLIRANPNFEGETLAIGRPSPREKYWQYMHLMPKVPYNTQKLHQISDSEVVEVIGGIWLLASDDDLEGLTDEERSWVTTHLWY